ncbi:MAG: 2TM domain-containing protein [Parafilimonas sp.]
MNTQQHDEKLWRIAKRRASFKTSLAIYFFVNLLFVLTWYLSSGSDSYFWPIWPMFLWGIGLAFQYTSAYNNNGMFSAQSEYDRLKNQQNNPL